MITRRQTLAVLALSAMASAITPLVHTQEPKRIPRIGMLALNSGELLEPLREGLRTLGYVDGKNIRLEERAAGDRYEKLSEFAGEFVKLNVDVIVTSGSTATTAAQRATSTIPIVMIAGMDPVKAGFASSLARPGRNVTGLATSHQDVTAKHFELAKELVPELARVAVLVNPESRTSVATLADARAAAKRLGVALQVVEINSVEQFPSAFEKLARAATQALVVLPSSMMTANRKSVIALAANYRIPGIYSGPRWVEDGGLASYGSDSAKARKEAARYIDKILRGAKPGDLPIEQPNTLVLALNLRTARALGLQMPQVVLLRADKVIE